MEVMYFRGTVQASAGSLPVLWLLKGLHLLGGREWDRGNKGVCLPGFPKEVCVRLSKHTFPANSEDGSVCLPERGKEKNSTRSPFGLCTGQDLSHKGTRSLLNQLLWRWPGAAACPGLQGQGELASQRWGVFPPCR